MTPGFQSKWPLQDVQRLLAQLIMLNGLQSNPDIPGTEKMVITSVDEKWLTERRLWISSSELELETKEKLIPPQSVFLVKGWNRSMCALLVLLAAFEMVPLLEARCF